MSLANELLYYLTCLIGSVYVYYLLFKCLKFIWEVLKTTFVGGNIDFTRFGEWAGSTFTDLCFDID